MRVRRQRFQLVAAGLVVVAVLCQLVVEAFQSHSLPQCGTIFRQQRYRCGVNPQPVADRYLPQTGPGRSIDLSRRRHFPPPTFLLRHGVHNNIHRDDHTSSRGLLGHRCWPQWTRHVRHRLVQWAAICLVVFACHVHAALATTGGRIGGSFGPSTMRGAGRPPPSSSTRLMPRQHHPYYRGRGHHYGPRVIIGQPPPVHVHNYGANTYADSGLYGTTGVAPPRPLRATDVAVVGATGALLAYSFTNRRHGRDDNDVSSLGPGATVATVTFCMDVPNRHDRHNILARLQALSDRTDTTQRPAVQDLMTEVALELSRQASSIVSAQTTSTHYHQAMEAQRGYQTLSIQARSKFEREVVNKYGTEERSENKPEPGTAPSLLTATSAVVTLQMAIQGDSTALPRITDRASVAAALIKLASDAQVDNCLLAGQVLWAPADGNDYLVPETVVADYPDLVPL